MPNCGSKEKSSLVGSEVGVAAITGFEITTCQLNESGMPQTTDVNNTTETLAGYQKSNDDILIKVPALMNSRERRNVSPSSYILNETYVDPHSPSSSSSTSQTTNDATFEPTIEMMVNDFDDEQTLNEEEALASFESQNPDDEINTLKKESEMPLEELLAKYRDLPSLPPPSPYCEPLRKKSKKSSSHKEKHKLKKKQINSTQTSCKNIEEGFTSDFIAVSSKNVRGNLETFDAENCDENNLSDDEKVYDIEKKCSSSTQPLRKVFTTSVNKERQETDGSNQPTQNEISKLRRSHLLDLYPEGTFDNVVVVNDDVIAGNRKESLFGDDEDEEDGEIEEEEDEDYKKKVMIGSSYQAIIPVGLSQYGDILPYENEDKLIWEPSQVSEREVEEYLIKIRDIKSNQHGEEAELSVIEINSDSQSQEKNKSENKVDNLENNSCLANGDTLLVETVANMEIDSQAVVKDNEQALHLLVQCGYDFKEALRRKRLNALPLNDCMSLWSEEECHKFEEGIQKYGKDFLKIRQNQVRTRTMRELVQFYYLWKKSERRDHNFANADTVDHMDIYLNEDNEYGSNPSSVLTPVDSPNGNTSSCAGTGRNSNFSQKSISIMTTTTSTTQAAACFASEKNGSNTCLQQNYHPQHHHKRRTHSSKQISLNVTTANDVTNENMSNTSNSSK